MAAGATLPGNRAGIEIPGLTKPLRVIYYYWTGGPEFWLFTLYDKDEMADLTSRQRAELKERVKGELKMRRER
ncbi:MAG: hypothetical protein PVS2B1_21380 [Candidatus Dormibacteraceae bacterium]